MRTAFSALCLLFFIALPLQAQHDDSFNPLTRLGISFGDNLGTVIASCEQAGLTIATVDTGAQMPNGYYALKAIGTTYRGQPATVRLLSTDSSGLRSCWIIVDSDNSATVRALHDECVEELTGWFGETRHKLVAPDFQGMWRFSDERVWEVSVNDVKRRVSLQASTENPNAELYRLALQFSVSEH